MEDQLTKHTGSCHCGAVEFEFDAPADLVAWDCDCSICALKRNTHTMVPARRFRLLRGEGALSCYQFGTKTAKHLFCSVCGICPFYVPRSNPDSYAVTVFCIKPGTVKSIDVRRFEGTNWEASYAATGIAACSKGVAPPAAGAAGDAAAPAGGAAAGGAGS